MDKYKRISQIFFVIGVIWVLVVFAYSILSPCSDPNKFCFYCSGDCFGMMGVLIAGVLPATFLAAIAVIFFIIYKFKK